LQKTIIIVNRRRYSKRSHKESLCTSEGLSKGTATVTSKIFVVIILIDYNGIKKSTQILAHDSTRAGSLKYVPLDQPAKLPFLEKEGKVKSKAIASAFNITKNKRFSY
jgi:hypothetical protein